MAKLLKATIGVRPITKMFRVQTHGGAIADAIIGLRGSKLPDDYFEKVGWSQNRTGVVINSEAKGHLLSVDIEGIQFTVDRYESGARIDFHEFLKEFMTIWQTLDSFLKVRDIRRIGFVGEHRLPHDHPGAAIVAKLTQLNVAGHLAKSQIRFETRSKSLADSSDENKAGFTNIIYEIYDSQLDTDHPTPGFVNVNLDSQRYYAPVFNGQIESELYGLYNKSFAPASETILDDLREKGLANAKAEV